MEPTQPSTSSGQAKTTANPSTGSGRATARDFFLNLGAIVALYTTVFNLINLLFTVINQAYPQITRGYYYGGSQSISFPVATLIIFFPIFVFLMWVLEKGFLVMPEKKNLAVHKWLTYITLFIAGIALAGDLVTVLYYFIDGQELTTGFLLKILVVFVVASGIFLYYISDIRARLNSSKQKIWAIVSGVVILASIVWGFAVLGSPWTQRLIKYDEQKVTDLQNINSQIASYWQTKATLPPALADLSGPNNYFTVLVDQQTGKSYEYNKTGAKSYELCVEFNKDSSTSGTTYPVVYGGESFWKHPAGHYCFSQTVTTNVYPNYPKL